LKWEDEAIVISFMKHGETNGIVETLTLERGLHKGIIRNINNSKNRTIYQPGNLVSIRWNARLEEHLGSFTAELLSPLNIIIINNRIKLTMVMTLCSLISLFLPERVSEKKLYLQLKALIAKLREGNIPWQEYISFELSLLEELGFGLDLSKCGATNSLENLIYISPKSGRAISYKAGKPYKDKLLDLPQFLINSQKPSDTELNQAIEVSTYFLQKSLFPTKNITHISIRDRLIKYYTLHS
jgi:DNA repair protein RecO (recombination protein O)